MLYGLYSWSLYQLYRWWTAGTAGIRSSDPGEQAATVRWMAWAKDSSEVPEFVALLHRLDREPRRPEEAELRNSLRDALRVLPHPDKRDLLLSRWLEFGGVRAEDVLYILDEPAPTLWSPFLRDETEKVRSITAGVLADAGDKNALPALREALGRERNLDVRRDIASAMKRLGWCPAAPDEQAFLEVCLGDYPLAVSRHGARCIKHLLAIATDRSFRFSWIRTDHVEAAVRALLTIDDAQLAERVRAFAEPELFARLSAGARRDVISTLVRLDRHKAVNPLCNLLKGGLLDSDREAKSVLGILVWLKGDSVLEWLVDFLRVGSYPAAVMATLDRFDAGLLREPLKQLLKTEGVQYCDRGIWSAAKLVTLGEPEGVRFLLTALTKGETDLAESSLNRLISLLDTHPTAFPSALLDELANVHVTLKYQRTHEHTGFGGCGFFVDGEDYNIREPSTYVEEYTAEPAGLEQLREKAAAIRKQRSRAGG